MKLSIFKENTGIRRERDGTVFFSGMVVSNWSDLYSFLFRRQAHLCVLANNCDEAQYVKLVEALCTEHNINLLKVRLYI